MQEHIGGEKMKIFPGQESRLIPILMEKNMISEDDIIEDYFLQVAENDYT
jgi:hypothetical protein